MGHKLIGACGAFVLLMSMTGCGSSGFTVRGQIDLTSIDGVQGDGDTAGSSCRGQNGYDDIDEGAQIVIKDADGKQIALGALDGGKLTAGIDDVADTACRFTFTVKDVPDKGNIYTIAIGHRDDYSFKKSEASDLSLTLG